MGKKFKFHTHLAASRRKRQRLPSSRCIESAQTHRARVCSLLTRASDTTLRLIVTNRPDMDNCRVAGVVERSSLDTAYLRQQIGGLSSGLMITFHESTS